MNRKEYQNEWKKRQRILNTDYAQRVRASKRTDEYKTKRREKRKLAEVKEKERLYQAEYRKRPEVMKKVEARYQARRALVQGKIKRTDNCEICGKSDEPLWDGRSGLRMDHYLGYEKENWLKVKFICVECDGKQLRRQYENSISSQSKKMKIITENQYRGLTN